MIKNYLSTLPPPVCTKKSQLNSWRIKRYEIMGIGRVFDFK